MQGGLFFEARKDGPHTYRDKATAVQPSPLTADHIVGMKIAERNGAKEIALERGGASDQLRELLSGSAS